MFDLPYVVAEILADLRDDAEGYECISIPPELPNIRLHPQIKQMGPNLVMHYVVASKLWGEQNGRRYYNVLSWEFSHRRKLENAPGWKGGKSFEPYCPKFTSELKESVRDRFGRKCIVCGKSEKENGKKLSIHHVDYDKQQGCNGKPWRLVPLCASCHTKTNNNRDFWEQKIASILEGSCIVR